MRRRPTRSVPLAITLASVAVALAVAILLGWILVISQNLARTREVAQNTTLLVAGIVSLATIITVLVMFTVFLVGQIREVRRQDSFIDSVTHELKSPLASLRLCIDTLQRPELGPEQQPQVLQMMIESVDRLSLFIDDVLQASLLLHGKGPIALVEVDLAELARRCVTMVGARYHLQGGGIEVDVPAGLRLSTDASALELVLRNLLDNAVKYSPPPPRVTLRAEAGPREVLVEVRDRGIGIPRAELSRVFERFYRVSSEEVRQRHGTGLGLFVASSLVRGLGGRIEATSDGLGTGTTMRVHLPAAPGATA